MRRFEVWAAWIVGAALPVLEACRRRTDFSNLPAYVDDFIAGGILLYAAAMSSKRRAHGAALLVAAWGIFCGGLYYSFWGQVRAVERHDISGLPNWVVVAIKGALFVVGLVALVRSVRAIRMDGDGTAPVA